MTQQPQSEGASTPDQPFTAPDQFAAYLFGKLVLLGLLTESQVRDGDTNDAIHETLASALNEATRAYGYDKFADFQQMCDFAEHYWHDRRK